MSGSAAALRVCHVSPHFPPDQGANALLPVQLARWQTAAGLSVRFVSHEPAQGGSADEPLPGPVRRLARSRRSGVAKTLRIARWTDARRLSRALDEMAADADLLHLHSNGLIVEVAAAWARRHRRPYVLTLYGTEIWHYRRRPLVDPFTRAYHGAAEVTFYSQRLEQHARAVGLGRPRLSVVYPAVSAEFTPANEPARAAARASLGIGEARVVLNVKRLHELAGQRFLIDAFARIARRRGDVRLIICGTGPLRAELEAQVARTGLTARVTFTGLMPNHEVARYAAVADVFALPSLLEALPTVAVEALAAGTPVVSADHPGGEELHELFGEDVQLVPRGDVNALAVALESRLDQPRRTTQATLEVIQASFSPSAVYRAYSAVYARVMERTAT